MCDINDCHNDRYQYGWCQKHYTRWYRHGDPLGGGPEQPQPGDRLDAGPLVDAISRCVESVQGEMTQADRRAFYRARKRGWVGERIADRMALRYCGLLLEELYGWDYEGAA